MSGREAFDQSFELYASQADDEATADFWNDEPKNKLLDTTFESDPFEFSAISSIQPKGQDGQSTLFPEDPFQIPTPSSVKQIPTVRVGVHEQLSAIYDEVSSEGNVQVEGSIHVKPLKNSLSAPFCLVCRDLLDHIESFEERSQVCRNISDQVSRDGLHPSDRVLRVILSDEVLSSSTDGVSVANYSCVPGLRPVPMVRISVATFWMSNRAFFSHMCTTTGSW